jgi:hypothetical protein
MSLGKKQPTHRDRDGLSPHKRPKMQGFLEQVVSQTIQQLEVTTEQRDQHRILRSLIRMSARVSIFMGDDLEDHLKLVAELWLKCKADIEAGKKALPAGYPKVGLPKFHNSVLSVEAFQEKIRNLLLKGGK